MPGKYCLVDVKSKEETFITDQVSWPSRPAASPECLKFAYSGTKGIRVVDIGTKKEKFLVSGSNPIWGPSSITVKSK